MSLFAESAAAWEQARFDFHPKRRTLKRVQSGFLVGWNSREAENALIARRSSARDQAVLDGRIGNSTEAHFAFLEGWDSREAENSVIQRRNAAWDFAVRRGIVTNAINEKIGFFSGWDYREADKKFLGANYGVEELSD